MKQTAVEWLIKELYFYPIDDIVIDKFNQAKEMEKEQMMDAWNDGYREFYDGSSTPEQYYNKSFKSE